MPRPRRTKALQRFLQTESGSATLLLMSAALALVWANTTGSGYDEVWLEHLGPGGRFPEDLRGWINEGLMTAFFFIVGLEIKRELTRGELTGLKQAALPVAGAVGGMVFPALVYLLFDATGSSGQTMVGWPIPMATDIAFAIGMVSLLTRFVPLPLKVFILALAIVDDIGAVAVIAFLRPDHVHIAGVALAAGLAGLALTTNKRWALRGWSAAAVALALWAAFSRAGLHPTLAGVVAAFLIPSDTSEDDNGPIERYEKALHPWTSLIVLPVFALANAGVPIGSDFLTGSTVTLGVAAGLVIGKTLGISAGALAAVKLGVAALPAGVTRPQIMGGAAICGIGFTVALFMAGLVFEQDLLDQAKVGILLGSGISASLGAVILWLARPRTSPEVALEEAS